MITILAASILLLLPGYVTLSVYRPRSGRRHDPLETLFTGLTISILVSGLCGLFLTQLGRLSLAGTCVLTLMYSALVAVFGSRIAHLKVRLRPSSSTWRPISQPLPDVAGAPAPPSGPPAAGEVPSPDSRQEPSESGRGLRPADLLAILFLAVAAALFFRPFENVVGGRDGGVYVTAGVHIARTGSFHIAEPFLDRLPEAVQHKLNWLPPDFMYSAQRLAESGWSYRYKYPGFYWISDQEKLIPQGLALYPTWVGLFYALFGLGGALAVAPLFAWLSVLGIYLVGRRLISPAAGLAALALLAGNGLQIWFARYANADVLFEFLFLAGLFFWIRFTQERDQLSPALAGGCFGTCLLLKLDSLPLAVIVILLLAIFAFAEGWSRGLLAFALPFGALVAWAGVQALTLTWPTYVYPGMYFITPGRLLSAVFLGFGAAAVIAGAPLLRRTRPFRRAYPQARRLLRPLATTAAGCILAAGCLVLIPGDVAGLRAVAAGTSLPLDLARENMVKLSWYLVPLGGLLWIAGMAYLVARRHDHGALWLLFLAGSYILLNLTVFGMGRQDHPWVMRRTISVVVPGIVLFTAYLLDQTRRLPLPGRLRSSIPVVLALALLVPTLPAIYPMAAHAEFRGAISEVDRWQRMLPASAISVFDSSWLGNYLAPPLSLIYGRDTLVFWPGTGEPPFDQTSLDAVVSAAAAQDRAVIFVSTQGEAPSARAYGVHRLRSGRFVMPLLEYAVDRLPRSVEPRDMPYVIYQLEPGPGRRVYEGEALSHQVGKVVDDLDAAWGEAAYARPGEDARGYLTYGPYDVLPPGNYRASFRIKAGPARSSTGPLAVVDVASNTGQTVLAERTLDATDPASPGAYVTLALDFANPAEQPLEFRVFFAEAAELWVDAIEVSSR